MIDFLLHTAKPSKGDVTDLGFTGWIILTKFRATGTSGGGGTKAKAQICQLVFILSGGH